METPKADCSIEKFLKDLDNDLVCYASFFRVLGFTSSRTIKFLKENDFISLGVEVPTGHRRLILNAVEKLQTPVTKKMLSIESPEIVRNKQRLDNSRKLKLFPETEDKDKGDLNDVDVYEEDDMSETEQDTLSFPCNRPLPNPRHRPRPRKRQSTSEMNTGELSPIERMFQHKHEEITA